MSTLNLAEDIVPLSTFRTEVTRLVVQTRKTHRPIVVTQNGRASNAFLDVQDYQKLVDTVNLLLDIHKGEQDIASGKVHSTSSARKAVAKMLGVSAK